MTQHRPLFHITPVLNNNIEPELFQPLPLQQDERYSLNSPCGQIVAKMKTSHHLGTIWSTGDHLAPLRTILRQLFDNIGNNLETTLQLWDGFGTSWVQLWDNLERNLGRLWDIVGTTLRQFGSTLWLFAESAFALWAAYGNFYCKRRLYVRAYE